MIPSNSVARRCVLINPLASIVWLNYHFVHRSSGWLIGARDICSVIVSTSAFSVLSRTDFTTSPNFPASFLSILPPVSIILLAFPATSRYTRIAGGGAPQIRAGTEPILELCPMAVNSKPNTPYSLKRLICGYEPSKPVICASPRARDNRICF